MKFNEQIEKFVELRIEGKSFDDIAKELKTAKQTLIEWNKTVSVREVIAESKRIKINHVVKTFQFDLENRLNSYLTLSERLKKELATRDLTDVPTDKLLTMWIANDSRIKDIVSKSVMIGSNKGCVTIGTDMDGYFEMELDE
jgi:hypothetical protein